MNDIQASLLKPSADGTYTLQTEGLTHQNISEFGLNILDGREPVIQDAEGNHLKPMWGGDISLVAQCAYYQHIDIWGIMPVTVSYDMGEEIAAEQVVVGSMYHGGLDYGTKKYELYFSNSLPELYAAENRVVEYDNTGVWKREEPVTGAAQVYRFNRQPKGRYFGIRVLDPNTVDRVIRIGRLAVYNSDYTRQHSYMEAFGNNLLKGARIRVYDRNDNMFWPQYGYWNMLTDGVVAGKTTTMELRVKATPAIFTYSLEKADCPNTFVIVGDKDHLPRVELYVSADEPSLFHQLVEETAVETEPVMGNVVSRVVHFKEVKNARYVAILLHPAGENVPIRMDQFGLFSDKRLLRVDETTIVNDAFYGVGANLVPFTLQPGNIKAGYTRAHWALDFKRILMAKPRFIRVWVQVDWMEKTKGNYDFNTPEMQGLYDYFEAFKQAGTEVQLTFSWKVGEEIQSWFSIPEISAPYESAPADIEAYARSASALFRECWRRGYDNVKHITIANEPNLGDFMCFGDPREYYAATIKALDRQLKQDGIRDKIKIWATECVTDYSWLAYIEEQVGDCIDVNCMHEYVMRSEQITPMMKQITAISTRPFIMSEFCEGSFTLNAWHKGYAGYITNGANHGMSGLLNWTLCGVKSMSPSDPNSWELSGYGDLWRPLLSGGKPQKSYYIMSMLMQYLPTYSKVLKTDLSGNDLRAAVFRGQNGEISILVENNAGANRELSVVLPASLNGRTFYKHQYNPPYVTEEDNLIVPTVCGEFVSEEGFCDTLEDGYAVTIYTTMKPQTQVAMDTVWNTVKPGESIKLGATVVDNAAGVVWTVAEGEGTVSQDGVYTAAGHSGYVAVKATSQADPEAYGISLIHICD